MKKTLKKKLLLILSGLLVASSSLVLSLVLFTSFGSKTSKTTPANTKQITTKKTNTRNYATTSTSKTEKHEIKKEKKSNLDNEISTNDNFKNKNTVTKKILKTTNKEKKKYKQYKQKTANAYQPYIQVNGKRFFNTEKLNFATAVDLFIPLWQLNATDLVFADLRINDHVGTPFEGNIHFGYRHLFSDNQKMFGIYGAFDNKKTQSDKYFSQITLGGEYWIKNWFIGGNVYKPIGNTVKLISQKEYCEPYTIQPTKDSTYEKAMAGVDAEIGYEFKNGLTTYVGGYYFNANDVSAIYGPKVRLSYDWSLKSGKRILGIFDKVGLETGTRKDKVMGTAWYLSANFRMGWLPSEKTDLSGVSRHMIDPIRRDIDIVSTTFTKQEKGDERIIETPEANVKNDGDGAGGTSEEVDESVAEDLLSGNNATTETDKTDANTAQTELKSDNAITDETDAKTAQTELKSDTIVKSPTSKPKSTIDEYINTTLGGNQHLLDGFSENKILEFAANNVSKTDIETLRDATFQASQERKQITKHKKQRGENDE